MMEDIKKILEAVANGEITPEEGERLIEALKEREEKGKKEEKREKKEKMFRIGKDEIIDGEIVLSGETVIIEGILRGDAVLTNCNTELSGEIDGDAVFIGGKVKFNGGKVRGDLVLIGTRYTGEEPEVEGEYVKISNFFVNVLMTALSPILSGLKIRGKPFKGDKIQIRSGMRNVVVPKGASVSMELVEGERLTVYGKFEAESVSVEKSRISGEAVVGKLKSEKILIDRGGILKVVNLKAEKISCEGNLEADEIEAELINVAKDGVIKAKHVKCEKITGSGRVEADVLEAESIDKALDISRGDGNARG